MAIVEGLQFRYLLHPLAPGRFGFRRWRFELWHGASMVAAGWRVSLPDAQRALAVHGAGFGHRLFGLRTPPRPPDSDLDGLRRGATVRVDTGAVSFELVAAAAARSVALAG